MKHFVKVHKGQSGEAALIIALIVSAVLGSAVYYALDKTVLKQKQQRMMLAKDRSKQLNISSLSQTTALMSYTVPNPDARNSGELPFLFPDPYMSNTGVGQTRTTVDNVATWSFSAPYLKLYGASPAALSQADFVNYVTTGKRPALTQPVTVNFMYPIMGGTPATQNMILGYHATVTTASSDGMPLTLSGDFPVPLPAVPHCSLQAVGGQQYYQPDALIPLTLFVSGVAQAAIVPMTASDLMNGTGTVIDLTTKAVSVRNTAGKQVYSWNATAPRPLYSVDGNGYTPVGVNAMVIPVDGSGPIACDTNPTWLYVATPSNCMLYTDHASVSPGSCAQVSWGQQGDVVGGIKLSAADSAGNDFTQNITPVGAGFNFCTPAIPAGSGGSTVQVPANLANRYSQATTGLTSTQMKALVNVMQLEIQLLTQVFASAPSLQNLSIAEANDLSNLDPGQLVNFSSLNLSKFTNLSQLNATQINAIAALTAIPAAPHGSGSGNGAVAAPNAAMIAAINNMNPPDITSVSILSGLSTDLISAFNSYDPALFTAFLQQGIATKAALDNTTDYVLTGTINDTLGNKSTCITHVTAGTNQCPYFGPNYPNVQTSLLMLVNSYGDINNQMITFNPGYPNYEVSTVSNTPVDVEPCPSDARCFAMETVALADPTPGNNRTAFVTVDAADSSSCTASTATRIDLGCFDLGTKIRMGNGEDLPVQHIKVGDLVLNPLTHQPSRVKRTTIGPEKKDLVVIQVGLAEIRVTTQHAMLTKTGVKAAEQLHPGDEIMDQSAHWLTIEQILREKPRHSVVNIELEGASSNPEDHAVLAGGLITGDLYLQEHLSPAASD